MTSLAACGGGGSDGDTDSVTDADANAATESDAASDSSSDTESESETETGETDTELPAFVDYASTQKFDPNSGRAYLETSVHLYVDGDTTHFNVPTSVVSTGILKARYLGINTPESTGQIEPWGKKASDYTKAALQSATSIIVESNSDTWNPDSTGERYLVWVWYKTAENDEYRCLNLEILQAGLAVGSKSSDTAYADVCIKILDQAVNHKLYVHSKEQDPDFYYGDAIPMTLKELKTNIETYKAKVVSFEGVVVHNSNQTAYVEEYDEETGVTFGIQVFYGYNLGYFGEEILKVGNRVRIVGNVQYYEAGGTYQISDIEYNPMDADNEANILLISEGHTAGYQVLDAKALLHDEVELQVTSTDENGDEMMETKSFDLGFLSMHSSATLEGLTIKSIYTTQNEASSNKGAMSITCTAADGTTIVIRTAVLTDSNGNTVTESAFPIGSKINARGIVDVYDGTYQLKVFTESNIEILAD